jgi:hypothetical protein
LEVDGSGRLRVGVLGIEELGGEAEEVGGCQLRGDVEGSCIDIVVRLNGELWWIVSVAVLAGKIWISAIGKLESCLYFAGLGLARLGMAVISAQPVGHVFD